MPAHMLERWGVMPQVALDGAQRRAVAEYVWTLETQPHHGVDPGAAAHGHHRHSGGSR
jgi:mono/diheme cytochrome c family protein